MILTGEEFLIDSTCFVDIMIDIETLGTAENAVFPVICAYKFDPKTGRYDSDCFYRNIDIHDQVLAGREVDGYTIEWWFKQGQNARDELMAPGDKLADVLSDFVKWLPENAVLWSNSCGYDLSKIANAFGYKKPWKFWNERDMRTVVKISGIETSVIEFEGIKHYAKDDCVHQIKVLHEAFVSLGLGYENG